MPFIPFSFIRDFQRVGDSLNFNHINLTLYKTACFRFNIYLVHVIHLDKTLFPHAYLVWRKTRCTRHFQNNLFYDCHFGG